MLDLNYLCKMSFENARKRAEHEPTIKLGTMETLKHCVGEVVEATEAYTRFIRTPIVTKEAFADELADIICCVLTICGQENIDIELALTKCMEKNADRAERGGK